MRTIESAMYSGVSCNNLQFIICIKEALIGCFLQCLFYIIPICNLFIQGPFVYLHLTTSQVHTRYPQKVLNLVQFLDAKI